MSKPLSPIIVLFSLFLFSTHAQAGLWDDFMSLFDGDDANTEAGSAEQVEQPGLIKSATSAAAATAIQVGVGLMPSVVKALGVTDQQAKGGLGAIFMAARATLAPADYKLIANSVPGIDSYIAAAPPTNALVGGAMGLLKGSKETAAIANLVTQFHDLGLGTDMIAKFSRQAIDYVETNSPEASGKLMGVVADYL